MSLLAPLRSLPFPRETPGHGGLPRHPHAGRGGWGPWGGQEHRSEDVPHIPDLKIVKRKLFI